MTDVLHKPHHPAHAATHGPLPARKLTREDIANIELGHTAISRRTAWLLFVAFVLTIISVPLGEHLASLYRWTTAAEDAPVVSNLPEIYGVRELLPSVERIAQVRDWRDAYELFPSAGEIQSFETGLEETSSLAGWLIPRVQWLLTVAGGTGNEQALVGNDGWLFYKPAVEYLTGAPFLEEGRLSNITRFTDRSPDPLPAIVQLHEQLAARDIRLVLMPTPGKAQVHPEQLAAGYDDAKGVLQNPSYEQFMERLEAAGVTVFDPGPLMFERKASGRPQYLQTDTHWTPEAMQAVGQALAAELKAHLPAGDSTLYTRSASQVSNLGDVAVMLKLPEAQTIYPRQEVTIAPVTSDGKPWSAEAGAPVLLLGDSFSNIYSQAELGWGEGAGLAEQLSAELGLPVDRVVINAGGSHATRQRLAAEVNRDPRRLDGVRVVVWQFAQRELLAGDWRRIPLPAPSDAPAPVDTRPGEQMVIRGTIRAIGRPPEPGTVPYRDCLVAVHLDKVQAVQGSTEESELLVFIHGMRDNRLTPAARWSVGQEVELTLLPWEETDQAVQSTQQRLTDTDADFTITTWWYAALPK